MAIVCIVISLIALCFVLALLYKNNKSDTEGKEHSSKSNRKNVVKIVIVSISILLFLIIAMIPTVFNRKDHDDFDTKGYMESVISDVFPTVSSSVSPTPKSTSASSSPLNLEVLLDKDYYFSDESKMSVSVSRDRDTLDVSVMVAMDFDHENIPREYALYFLILNEFDNVTFVEDSIVMVQTGDEVGMVMYKNGKATYSLIPDSYQKVNLKDSDELLSIMNSDDYQVVITVISDINSSILGYTVAPTPAISSTTASAD